MDSLGRQIFQGSSGAAKIVALGKLGWIGKTRTYSNYLIVFISAGNIKNCLLWCKLNKQVSAVSGSAKASSKEDNEDVAEEAAKFADQEWDSIELTELFTVL